MITIKFIIQIIISLVYINIASGRVVYLLAHAEKPGDGILEERNENLRRLSSMDGLGFPEDGLVSINYHGIDIDKNKNCYINFFILIYNNIFFFKKKGSNRYASYFIYD